MKNTKHEKRILFITLSNIGDVILTIPTLLKLSKRYKNAKFDIVGDDRSKILFKYCPFINKFLIKDKSKGFMGTISLLRDIRKTNYDIAVDLRSDGLLYLIRADKKFHKIHNKNIHSIEKHYLSIKEEDKKIPEPIIWLSNEEKKKARQLLPKSFKKILAFGLGANSSHKIWPTKFYAELGNMLKQQFDLIVLIGDAKDNEFFSTFKKNYKGPLLNLSGKLDLLTTSAVLKKAQLFIGNDSGLGHIASAVNVNTFTIFGPGEPNRYRPWGPKASWIQDKQKEIKKIKPKDIYKKIIDLKYEIN
jgi:ADP-heptose:LPS heptosyltransferase